MKLNIVPPFLIRSLFLVDQPDGIAEDRQQENPSAFEPGLPLLEFRNAFRQILHCIEASFDAAYGSRDFEDFVFDVHGPPRVDEGWSERNSRLLRTDHPGPS